MSDTPTQSEPATLPGIGKIHAAMAAIMAEVGGDRNGEIPCPLLVQIDEALMAAGRRGMTVPSEYAALVAALHAEQERVILGKNHIYRVDGAYMVGVTTAIKVLDAPRLDNWRVKVQVQATARAAYSNPPIENEPIEAYEGRLARMAAEQYEAARLSDAAALLGTEIHALVEHSVKGQLGVPCAEPFVSDEAHDAFGAWPAWAADVDLVPLMAEARFADREHNYCGTVDLLALVGGELACLDWKSKPDVWPERRLQSAAYRRGLNSLGWPEMAGMIVAVPRAGMDGSAKAGVITPVVLEGGEDLERTFQRFLECVRLHRWLKDLERAEYKARVK